MFPTVGTRVAAPSSRLASLPVGGGCGLFVSLGTEGPALVPRDIEGGAPCRARRPPPRGDIPGPIHLPRHCNDRHDKEHLSASSIVGIEYNYVLAHYR